MKPWHRSRLFWLGLLPLVFLAWAWAMSGIYFARFSYIPSHCYSWDVFSENGCLSFRHIEDRGGTAHLVPVGFDAWIEPLDESGLFPWSDGFSIKFNPQPGFAIRVVGFGYWLVIATYLALWLACLVWWQRRRSRRAVDPSGGQP